MFGKARVIWGDKWTAHFTSNPDAALSEWIAATQDLTNEQIIIAFRKARNICEFPPSIAAFRKLALNVVSAEVAFLKAVKGDRTYRRFLDPWYWRDDNFVRFSELKSLFLASYREFLKNELNVGD